jgi:hypothetical protein
MAVYALQSGLDCKDCRKDQRAERGCEFDSATPDRWTIEGEAYQRCPLKLISSVSAELIQAYSFFKSGFLPNGGGWLNESAKFIQAMQAIEGQIAKEEKDARQ